MLFIVCVNCAIVSCVWYVVYIVCCVLLCTLHYVSGVCCVLCDVYGVVYRFVLSVDVWCVMFVVCCLFVLRVVCVCRVLLHVEYMVFVV